MSNYVHPCLFNSETLQLKGFHKQGLKGNYTMGLARE